MLESLGNPIGKRIFTGRLYRYSSIFLSTIVIFFIFGNERNESALKQSRQKNVTKKKCNRKDKGREKVIRMDSIEEPSEKFVLLFEDNNVGIGDLVENNTTQNRS
jgi:hypothetical protein